MCGTHACSCGVRISRLIRDADSRLAVGKDNIRHICVFICLSYIDRCVCMYIQLYIYMYMSVYVYMCRYTRHMYHRARALTFSPFLCLFISIDACIWAYIYTSNTCVFIHVYSHMHVIHIHMYVLQMCRIPALTQVITHFENIELLSGV